jgi:LmbE family N-acetylglucosaminyl deacetylase
LIADGVDRSRRTLRILAVYAHVADTAGEASGTIAIHAHLGDEITLLVCTDGERHHPALFLDADEAPGRPADLPFVHGTLEQIRALKRREAQRVGDVLGVSDVRFLGWEDAVHLETTGERIAEIAGIILDVRPDLILAPLPHHEMGGIDPHATVGRLTLLARAHAESQMRQVDGVAAHHPKELFYYPMGGEIADSRDPLVEGIVCDVWIDTSRVIERKVRALDQIVSQGYHGSVGRKIVEARDGRWGMLAGTAYAEPFLRGGRTYDELPMTPRVLERVYHPTDLPGDVLTANAVPSAVPSDGFTLPVSER